MENKVIKAAMLGLGTVGTGVYKVLKLQKEEMEAKIGARVELKKILVRNLQKAAQKVDDPSVLTNDVQEILDDPEIEIVIEVMGGIQPALSYMLEALNAGKSVVTANKDVVASEGKKLLEAAKANGRDFLYEASVGGRNPDRTSDETMPGRQSYHGSGRHFQRHDKLYPDENVKGRDGV